METQPDDTKRKTLTQLLENIFVSADELTSKARSINEAVNRSPEMPTPKKEQPKQDSDSQDMRSVAESIVDKLSSLSYEVLGISSGLGVDDHTPDLEPSKEWRKEE